MLHFQLNSFFSDSVDNMSVQKTQNRRFSELLPFSKILLVMKAEEELIEIPYKIATVILNLLHIKLMPSFSYQLINN